MAAEMGVMLPPLGFCHDGEGGDEDGIGHGVVVAGDAFRDPLLPVDLTKGAAGELVDAEQTATPPFLHHCINRSGLMPEDGAIFTAGNADAPVASTSSVMR
jgi:hypothetical protein